ncbi:MAG TPA: hypothetical protein VGM93_08680 [Acidimicrobiales bacterium]|jgi:predicted lipoprotein with Yx(FWY)xxD motif
MRPFTHPASRRVAAVVAIAALSLAACSSKKSDSSSSTSTTAAASATTAGSSASGSTVAIVAKKNDKLGSILASGPKELTMYTLTSGGKAVACTGACLQAWPAVTVPSASDVPTGPSGVKLAVADGPDGTHIVTANGLPVYNFVQDKDDEDAYGSGLKSFGGTWNVVMASGSAAPAVTTTTAASSGGY